jgi:hypothetical protein
MARSRRVQRIHLARPLIARLGTNQVVLVDVSMLGARIEHHTPLSTGQQAHLQFNWDEESIAVDCRIVRSRLERFSVGADGLTIYHSGLEFLEPSTETKAALKKMIERFITRALDEQKLNARGVMPQTVENMPIFRYGGQLTANPSQVAEEVGSSALPTARMTKESGYICFQLENRMWRKKRTHDPGQPAEGFTVSSTEDQAQIDLLCKAYEQSDADGRKMIQLFAQLSIAEGEAAKGVRGRFEP